MLTITPFLWFDTQAEEAAEFYVSIFRNSRITRVMRQGGDSDGGKGRALVVAFELDGLPVSALNGGPMFQFSEAVSLVVRCADQAEVDHCWERLLEGGTASRCGWLKDRFGFSWQIVPDEFLRMTADPDPAKVGRVMQAMMQMTKFDVARLREAYGGSA